MCLFLHILGLQLPFFNVCPQLLFLFFQSVVSSVLFYVAACWKSSRASERGNTEYNGSLLPSGKHKKMLVKHEFQSRTSDKHFFSKDLKRFAKLATICFEFGFMCACKTQDVSRSAETKELRTCLHVNTADAVAIVAMETA